MEWDEMQVRTGKILGAESAFRHSQIGKKGSVTASPLSLALMQRFSADILCKSRPIPLTDCFKAPLFCHTAASRAASSDMQPAPQAGGEMNGIAFPLHLTRYGKAPAFP